jgi:hypothetical protein
MELRNSGNELLGERLTRKNVNLMLSGVQSGNIKEIS